MRLVRAACKLRHTCANQILGRYLSSNDSKPSGNLTRLDWQTFDSSRQSAALREGVKLVATVGARQYCKVNFEELDKTPRGSRAFGGILLYGLPTDMALAIHMAGSTLSNY